ncbi:MAG: hypothetical protein ACE5GN_02120 [Waddliaceae bacterium]
MKNRFVAYTTACFSVFLLLTAIPLSAITVGVEGQPFTQDGIQWQPVYIQDDDTDLQAALPGKPTTGMSKGWLWVASQFQGSIYEIKTPVWGYVPPATLDELLNQVQPLLPEGTSISTLESTQPAVKFVLECHIQQGGPPRILRIYTTETRFYIALVQDGSFAFSDPFFGTINILK